MVTQAGESSGDASSGLLSSGALLSPQAAGGVPASHGMGGQTARPSLVVMFADNLGYGDVGALGAPSTRTPNVDSLVSHSDCVWQSLLHTTGRIVPPENFKHAAMQTQARDGMTLKHWISAASMCSPSRASLLTGRYHMRNGIYPLTIPADAVDGLPSNETTLAEHLREAGYATM